MEKGPSSQKRAKSLEGTSYVMEERRGKKNPLILTKREDKMQEKKKEASSLPDF